MHEIIRPASSEDLMDTTKPSDLTIIDDRTSQRPDCPVNRSRQGEV